MSRTHLRSPDERLKTVCGLWVIGLLLRNDVAGVTCRHCIRLAACSPASRALELRKVQSDWLDENRFRAVGGRSQ